MSVNSPASFGADSAASVDTLREIHAQCITTFESLVTNPEYSSQRWQNQLSSLRSWGQKLASTPTEPQSFATRLRDSGPLRDLLRAHLTTLHVLLKQADGQEQAETPSSFKIAGIDVLTSPSVQQEDESTRRNTMQFVAISKYVSDLGAFEGSPSRYPSYEQLRPPTRRSASEFDDGRDGSDPSSAASISPLAGPGQSNKRRRKFSISSSNGGNTPIQQISPGTDLLARQLQAMPGATSRLSPQSATETTLPPLSHTLHPGPAAPSSAAPRMRSPYDASQYPPPQPQAPPSHPYPQQGYPPPTAQMTFQQYPHPQHPAHYPPPPHNYPPPPNVYPPPNYPPQGPPPDKHPAKRPPSMTVPGPTSQPGPRVVPQAPHRLLIPNQQGEDPGSAVTPSPKLTKTGRVSKALRGEPVHACNVCDKVYTRAEHLRRHRSNHRVNLMRPGPPVPNSS